MPGLPPAAQAALATVPPGRALDFAVVGEAVAGLGFPVTLFVPRRLDALAAGWPVE